MTNNATLMLIAMLISGTSYSQFYDVEHSENDYIPLTVDTTHVDESAFEVLETPLGSIEIEFYQPIPLGFEFEFLGNTYSTVLLHKNGFAGFATLDKEDTTYDGAIPLFECPLEDYQDDQETSPIVYITDGIAGNRIFKCEFVKAGFTNDPEDNDHISFQLWIYEACNEFEVHIGPQEIDTPGPTLFHNESTSPFIGYVDNIPHTPWHLAGEPTDPYQASNPTEVLQSVPEEGTTYRFLNCAVGIPEPIPAAAIYPNPGVDQLTVEWDLLSANQSIQVLNTSGQIVLNEVTRNTNIHLLDISSLQPGMYILQVRGNKSVHRHTFIKK